GRWRLLAVTCPHPLGCPSCDLRATARCGRPGLRATVVSHPKRTRRSTMHAAPPIQTHDDASSLAFRRRWWALAVLCLSLVLVVVDNTILNVALPTIARDLGAQTSGLQWIV